MEKRVVVSHEFGIVNTFTSSMCYIMLKYLFEVSVHIEVQSWPSLNSK